MNWLYPTFKLRLLPAFLGVSVLGAAIAGIYGIIHDQITYSISEEYFTRLKFIQFAYADLGYPPRVWVGTIGFLASWWVGFFAGWFLARICYSEKRDRLQWNLILRGIMIMLACTAISGLIGCMLVILDHYDHESWSIAANMLGVHNIKAFTTVAFIHNGGYLGGLIGFIIAVIVCKRRMKTLDTRTEKVDGH